MRNNNQPDQGFFGTVLITVGDVLSTLIKASSSLSHVSPPRAAEETLSPNTPNADGTYTNVHLPRPLDGRGTARPMLVLISFATTRV